MRNEKQVDTLILDLSPTSETTAELAAILESPTNFEDHIQLRVMKNPAAS